MAEPVIHHRSPDFKTVFAETRCTAAQVFRTENEVLVFTASGTGAFESAVVESPLARREGSRRLARRFGTRWQKMAAAFGCDVVELTYDWGAAPPADGCLAGARRERRQRRAARALGDVDRRRLGHPRRSSPPATSAGAISVVDAISSLGAVPLETDAWGIDVVVTGSQKALMTPPGLAFVSVSEARLGEGRSRRRCRGSTGTGPAPGRTRRRAARRSRRRPRRSWRSTPPSG